MFPVLPCINLYLLHSCFVENWRRIMKKNKPQLKKDSLVVSLVFYLEKEDFSLRTEVHFEKGKKVNLWQKGRPCKIIRCKWWLKMPLKWYKFLIQRSYRRNAVYNISFYTITCQLSYLTLLIISPVQYWLSDILE